MSNAVANLTRFSNPHDTSALPMKIIDCLSGMTPREQFNAIEGGGGFADIMDAAKGKPVVLPLIGYEVFAQLMPKKDTNGALILGEDGNKILEYKDAIRLWYLGEKGEIKCVVSTAQTLIGKLANLIRVVKPSKAAPVKVQFQRITVKGLGSYDVQWVD